MSTKWVDPADWVFADWLDSSKTVLLNHLWDTLKGGADERVAFSKAQHDSSFAAADTFPDFNTLISVYLSGGGTPSNRLKIENSIFPEEVVQTDEVKSSGSDNSEPKSLNLSELLTGPLGYASGTLLGKSGGVALQSWQKQYFQVMNYPEFYWRPTKTKTGGAAEDWISLLEVQYIAVKTVYVYNDSTSSFVSAECKVTEPTISSTTNDVYNTNDLNESSPFSTPQEVRDYTIGVLDDTITDDNWATSQNNLANIGNFRVPIATISEEIELVTTSDDVFTLTCELVSIKFRFKLNDQYRATSPNRYTVPIQYNFEWGSASVTYDDFGLTKTEGNVELETITKDVNDFYLFEIPNPDYDNTAVLDVADATISQNFGLSKTRIVPLGVTDETGYYMKPNQSDGSAWEWFDP